MPGWSLGFQGGRSINRTIAQPRRQPVQPIRTTSHRRTRGRCSRTNGLVERLNETVFDELFREAVRPTMYETAETLRKELDKCLVEYNTQRVHQGCWDMGGGPIDTRGRHLNPSNTNSGKTTSFYCIAKPSHIRATSPRRRK
ncbi:integrase core domain-containing protein [Solidesulfovibrio sp.]|uniref:integrase core domain-containing protein n=1 Tax=Solidesulfovibrio sp. TaxID=2910990 RepID=UPI00344F9C9A